MAEKTTPKVILLKGNGGITINNEMMELLTITLAHGCIGLPLKALYAENVYVVEERENILMKFTNRLRKNRAVLSMGLTDWNQRI